MDVSHHVNAVQWAVGGRTLDAGEARVVPLRRSYPGPTGRACNSTTSRW